MFKPSRNTLLALSFVAIVQTASFAQWADTGVDVGPGHAGATAGANGDIWQWTDTQSRVGGAGSFGQGVAIGVGRNGVSFSHSIGANGGGAGVGHNINMTIGRNGSHVSHGGVTSRGGNSRVQVGGGSGQQFGGISGGSTATGWGRNTNTWSNSNTQRFPRVIRRW